MARQMTTPSIPGLLTVADAATALDRSTEQVRRYLREGRLRGRRLGGQWFIEEAALTAFRDALNDQSGYVDKLKTAAQLAALDGVVGIGHGGGSNIADGKDVYRRSSWWRR
jgi:excisionase family DNA binding protein